jgi:hypothetical protein
VKRLTRAQSLKAAAAGAGVATLGAFASEAQAATYDVIDVRDYGAQFDNVTDDTAAIQAALDAALTNPYGYTNPNDRPSTIVQMPKGRARVSGSLGLGPNVWFRGHGPANTYLVPNGAFHVVRLKTGTEVQTTCSDFGIIGPGPLVGTSGAGIYLQNTGQAGILGDARHVIRDVVVNQCHTGILVGNATETRIVRVTCQRPNAIGIDISASDLFVSDCTVAQPGTTGIRLAGGNSRVWGCKVFGGGFPNQAAFAVIGGGRHQVGICEAQDFNGHGFSVGGNNVCVLTACTADSCSGAGFRLDSVNGTARLEGVVVYRVGGSYKPQAGLRAFMTRGQYASIVVQDATGSNPFPELVTDVPSVNSQDSFEINYSRGWQNVPYAVALTPNPYNGGRVFVGTLTGPLTVNAPATLGNSKFPPGQELAFTLRQDATGGRSVTFHSVYKTTGPVDTTANKTTRVAFEWDGTNWVETGRSTV